MDRYTVYFWLIISEFSKRRYMLFMKMQRIEVTHKNKMLADCGLPKDTISSPEVQPSLEPNSDVLDYIPDESSIKHGNYITSWALIHFGFHFGILERRHFRSINKVKAILPTLRK